MLTETLTTCFGHKILCYKNDLITSKIKKHGLYEKDYVFFLLEILRKMKAPIVFDVGANIGNHALAFSTVANKVYSFEPVQQIYDLLDKNIISNNINNIIAIKKALSDNTAKIAINVFEGGNVGASSIERTFEKFGKARKETIESIIGDDFIKINRINKVDFVKIDTEFHEIHVLNGLYNSIKEFRPVIATEWSPGDKNNPEGWLFQEWGEDTPNEIINSLLNDYTIFFYSNLVDKNYWNKKYFGKLRRYFLKKSDRRNNALLLPYTEYSSNFYTDALFIPNEKLNLIHSYLSH